MQVAVSEALCRMTTRKCREELVYKWFPIRCFADSFKAINDPEFETLFKPKDDNLDKFWIDFNLGTSCISFFVNDPEGALWESINLPKVSVDGYAVLERDEKKVLAVQMNLPVTHCKIKGRTVRIFFEKHCDIENAAKKVFGEVLHLEPAQTERQAELTRATLGDPGNGHKAKPARASSSVSEEAVDIYGTFNLQETKGERSPQEEPDVFHLNDHSDTEEGKLYAIHGSFEEVPGGKGKSKNFQSVVFFDGVRSCCCCAFSVSASSSQAAPKPKESHKIWQSETESSPTQRGESESLHQRSLMRADYTRKKPKVKAKLKILPLSSSSSAEESHVVMHSTPKPVEGEQSRSKEKPFPHLRQPSLEYSLITPRTDEGKDAGLPLACRVSGLGPPVLGHRHVVRRFLSEPAVEMELDDSVFIRDDDDDDLRRAEAPIQASARRNGRTRRRKIFHLQERKRNDGAPPGVGRHGSLNGRLFLAPSAANLEFGLDSP
ncbi:hypothetical protein Z043_118560 [Scleropages formosus]|uniref:Synaptonemal complex protein 2 Spt16M-like domain-containing protein n=1 Tax=Scleropages formosus TaxID=113540 RepID=A0A0P7WPD7_SCLFO|nr:hypothetical protein Z043_118560 [Scleropages formosus]